MDQADYPIFVKLFSEATAKCFGRPMTAPLTEVESKLLSNDLLEQTGLVLGWKSLKNYSLSLLGHPSGKEENPSPATLDTLARYVFGAPRTDETQRQVHESHYPYWYTYVRQARHSLPTPLHARWKSIGAVLFGLLAFCVNLFVWLQPSGNTAPGRFTDDFRSVEEDSLVNRGWFLTSRDAFWWARRGEKAGHLTLYTLRGDSWPDTSEAVGIRNLLLRKLLSSSFNLEVHMTEFVPSRNWQQAGIILLEDTGLVGRNLRLSLAYNDFFGGFPPVKEILVQAVASLGKNDRRPEEIAHHRIFTVEPDHEELVRLNLKNSALRIEKRGKSFSFLCSSGSMENAPFKEVTRKEFDMEPKYVGVFALKGFVSDTVVAPVRIKYFTISE